MYFVVWKGKAFRQLSKFEERVQRRIDEATFALDSDPRPPGCKRLVGRPAEWRIRIGDVRILYAIDDSNRRVVVFSIEDRDDAYRR